MTLMLSLLPEGKLEVILHKATMAAVRPIQVQDLLLMTAKVWMPYKSGMMAPYRGRYRHREVQNRSL